MCILCVVQRWSRRIATMLPRLVIPLIVLWAFSQLLPPGYRFEFTSPRVACVSVLLLTLFWYEILLPRVSLWYARRSERQREERLAQALKLQKLRKAATRRCRNCNTAYRDQNPGGGKFMCSYCGHISKRPVLDLPGMTSEGKSRWSCSQDWSTEGNGRGLARAVPWHWLEDRCSPEKSYNGVVVFSWRLFSCFFLSVRWICRKIFPFGGSREDESSDEERKRASKRGDNGSVSNESRIEKARRKAEEKRLARLEKEMLEEEERKQREEVARLVEERRKIRDEKQEAEERSKGATPVGEKESRKEAERRRLERRKEKDKASSKSNSDCEELDRSAASKESERKREYDKKSETEKREAARATPESAKSQSVTTNKSKYFSRVTGNFLSSSRGLSGASFFGRGTQNSAAPVTKSINQAAVMKQASPATAPTLTKNPSGGDNRTAWGNVNRPVVTDVQPPASGMIKSWHSLFAKSSTVSPSPETGGTTYDGNNPAGIPGTLSTNQTAATSYPLDNHIGLGQPLSYPVYPSVSAPLGAPALANFQHIPMGYPHEPPGAEEQEQFEDPCYDPNAIALLGPVSESLDSFPLDLGSGFISSDVSNKPLGLNREMRPSPIESPLSRSRVYDEKNMKSSQLPPPVKKSEMAPSRLASDSTTEQGTWQMWGTPVVRDSLELVNGHSSWFLNPGSNYGPENGISRSAPLAPPIAKTNGGTYNPVSCGLMDSDLWVPKQPFESSFAADGKSIFLPANLTEDVLSTDVNYGSPNGSATTVHPFELHPANVWSK